MRCRPRGETGAKVKGPAVHRCESTPSGDTSPQIMSERLRNPAVVLDPGAAGIGIIHALSLAGVPTVAVVRNWPPMISRLSRFLRHCETYSPRRGETVLDGLERLARRFDGKGVLFPSTDIDLEAIIIGRERLAARYRIPASPQT